MSRTRLAIIAGHPVQYVAPWLAELARDPALEIKVFYLWDFGVADSKDPWFGVAVKWDIPMLEGYQHCFIRNRSRDPGNHHFFGYDNPTLARDVHAWRPDVGAADELCLSHLLSFLLDARFWRVPFLFRGDSHDRARSPGSVSGSVASCGG